VRARLVGWVEPKARPTGRKDTGGPRPGEPGLDRTLQERQPGALVIHWHRSVFVGWVQPTGRKAWSSGGLHPPYIDTTCHPGPLP
jgi:hypothetical protein